ncbi:FtsK/SpoIIIE domain-containing protein [Kitasatospora mediocidica]|uniref:FtsK/SpoIIIE domain-containing protein n=1 Tax=Kitasatospora mediocidica TaxID=58352 RepID=UPI00068B17EF|nr:FtsK/SpoIIIE domain-containing protein [Kitasatospora mediocidica]
MSHPVSKRGIKTAAVVLAAAWIGYSWAVTRLGPTGGVLLLTLYAAVPAGWWAYRTYSLRSRIRRGWPDLSYALGLWQQAPLPRFDATYEYTWPRIARFRRHADGLDILIGLLPGQVPEQLAQHVQAIAHAWRVHRVEVTSPRRGAVVLRAWTSDPLAEPFTDRSAVKPKAVRPRLLDRLKSWRGMLAKLAGRGRFRLVGGAAQLQAVLRSAWLASTVELPGAGRGTAALAAVGGSAEAASSGSASATEPLGGSGPQWRSVEIGSREDGKPWRQRLHGTHVLVAGVTGAGKGSILWGVVRGLLPAVAVGLVQIWALDPKRMELSFGVGLFTRYASDPERMVDLLEDAVERMQERAHSFAGRLRAHTPSASSPFIVLLVDELAFLTAYQPDRDLRRRAEAAIATLASQGRSVGFCLVGALQDPRKEVMNLRNLFPDRIALRMDEAAQVDMVLGSGARARGALADLISPDPHTGAGVGYVRDETSPDAVRVRAAYVSDSEIERLVAQYCRDSSPHAASSPLDVHVSSLGEGAHP